MNSTTDYTIRKELSPFFYWIFHKPWYHAPDDVRLATMLEF